MSAPCNQLVRSAFLTLAFSTCWIPCAIAQWPTDPSVNLPICTRESQFPVAVTDGAGGAIVAWEDEGAAPGPGVIYAQRVSASGAVQWATNGVALTLSLNAQYLPRIVSDGLGGAIVVWQDYRSGTNYDLYAQRVNASGALQWTTSGVPVCTAAGDQVEPSICSDGAGGAIIAWSDARPGALPGGTGMYAVRISSAGAVFAGWTANGLKLNSGFNTLGTSTIASDGANGAFAVWPDGRVGGIGGLDLYGQHVTGSGALSPGWPAAGSAIATAANQQWAPAMIPDGSGGALIAWQDNRATAAFGFNDIYVKRITGAGLTSPGWTTTGNAFCTAAGNQFNPNIVSSGAGGAIVAWQDGRGAAGAEYAQRVTSGAAIAPGWPVDGLAVCTSPAPQGFVVICQDGSGGVIACWQDLRSGQNDLFAQRVTSLGLIGPNWPAVGEAVSIAASSQEITQPQVPVLVSDGGGGGIMVWTDLRTGITQIYAQKIERFGHLGDPAPRISSVLDVPNDQGGFARVAWTASYLDADPVYEVSDYWIWRQVPGAVAMSALERGASVLSDETMGDRLARDVALRVAAHGRTVLREHRVGPDAFFWEFVATQPARGFPGYSYVAPAATNAASGPNVYTVFMIEALGTAGPPVFWDSPADSGFTADNLAPAPPSLFTGNFVSSGAPGRLTTGAATLGSVALHWQPNQEADFAEYHLHRGSSSGFTPGPGNLLTSSPDTGYVDVGVNAIDYYKLIAVDAHGNESGVALVGPNEIVAAPIVELPTKLWLGPAYPNPARADVTFQYDLPRAAQVSLTIFDARGRQQRTLVHGTIDAGRWSVPWNLRDDAGRLVPSGAYFYRLVVEDAVLQGRLLRVP